MITYILDLKNYKFNFNHYLLNNISQQRKDNLLKYKNDIDKNLSLYSELLVKMSIASLCNIDISKIILSKTTTGKPICKYPKNIYFNFSHTKSSILLSISKSKYLGVDIEKIKNAPFDIVKSVFNHKEINFLHRYHKYSKNYNFFYIWTRKEAYLKSIGIGLVENLNNINILDKKYNNNFHTFTYNNYICSIYSKNINVKNNKIIIITKKEVDDFYKNNQLPDNALINL